MSLKKVINSLLMISSFAVFSGCPAQTNEPPTPPTPTPIVTDTDQCAPAEQHLHDLCSADPGKNNYCCRVVAPTKKGKSYTQFCQEKQNEGVFLNPKCIESVTSCDQIDACTHSQ